MSDSGRCGNLRGLTSAAFPHIHCGGLCHWCDQNAPPFLVENFRVRLFDAEIFGDGDVVGFVVTQAHFDAFEGSKTCPSKVIR